MIVFPNAKINIGLRIVEHRNDGFHNIESIFYPISNLFDVLEVVKSQDKKVQFISSGIEIPGDSSSNLCLKAFHLLKDDFSLPSVNIHLHKNIPIGAGLGGGSSDAAFMLKLLNELFKLKLSSEQLISYAKKLGSDCAFFIVNKPVYAFNKGEDFEFVDLDLSEFDIQIKFPEINIGTAEAYARIVPKQSNINLRELVTHSITDWKGTIVNDFEASVFPIHDKIGKLKSKMYTDGAIFASMSGSGSAVFGIFKKEL